MVVSKYAITFKNDSRHADTSQIDNIHDKAYAESEAKRLASIQGITDVKVWELIGTVTASVVTEYKECRKG